MFVVFDLGRNMWVANNLKRKEKCEKERKNKNKRKKKIDEKGERKSGKLFVPNNVNHVYNNWAKGKMVNKVMNGKEFDKWMFSKILETLFHLSFVMTLLC